MPLLLHFTCGSGNHRVRFVCESISVLCTIQSASGGNTLCASASLRCFFFFFCFVKYVWRLDDLNRVYSTLLMRLACRERERERDVRTILPWTNESCRNRNSIESPNYCIHHQHPLLLLFIRVHSAPLSLWPVNGRSHAETTLDHRTTKTMCAPISLCRIQACAGVRASLSLCVCVECFILIRRTELHFFLFSLFPFDFLGACVSSVCVSVCIKYICVVYRVIAFLILSNERILQRYTIQHNNNSPCLQNGIRIIFATIVQ